MSDILQSSLRAACAILVSLLGLCAFASQPQARGIETLSVFKDGRWPSAPLPDDQGNLYGAVAYGGKDGGGYVYKLSPDGLRTVLAEFGDRKMGAEPGGLVRDAKGNLFGTTATTTLTRNYLGNGGSVFEITANGTFRTLRWFHRTDPSGYEPSGRLVMDAQGNLYGATFRGPRDATCCGAIFKIARNGPLTILHTFAFGDDGAYPQGPLTLDKGGNLYGTAESAHSGEGAVFRIGADGTFTTLHIFGQGADGKSPHGGILLDDDGNLFGTTLVGGVWNYGIVFKLTPDGSYSILHSFGSGSQFDGAEPIGPLVMNARGELFGLAATNTTQESASCGAAFKLRRDGSEKLIRVFEPHGPQGCWPLDGFTAGADGKLYGAVASGGRGMMSSIFELDTK